MPISTLSNSFNDLLFQLDNNSNVNLMKTVSTYEVKIIIYNYGIIMEYEVTAPSTVHQKGDLIKIASGAK